MADLIDSKLTVSNAIARATIPARANTIQLISMRKAKLCSHLFIVHQEIGAAIMNATSTSFTNWGYNEIVSLRTVGKFKQSRFDFFVKGVLMKIFHHTNHLKIIFLPLPFKVQILSNYFLGRESKFGCRCSIQNQVFFALHFAIV